ncbi:hypothetical protein JXJ21_08730 [candidate division KSB1 bacterium]|nr:hypothetical protein [candidate division KSB1 bacterium]
MSKNQFSTNFTAFWLVLLGTCISVCCFFLPWLKVKLLVGSMNESGFELSSKSSVLWVVIALAVIIELGSLFTLIFKRKTMKRIAIIASVLGIIFIVLIYFSITSEMQSGVKKVIGYEFHPAFWAEIAGFGIALLGTLFLRTRE